MLSILTIISFVNALTCPTDVYYERTIDNSYNYSHEDFHGASYVDSYEDSFVTSLLELETTVCSPNMGILNVNNKERVFDNECISIKDTNKLFNINLNINNATTWSLTFNCIPVYSEREFIAALSSIICVSGVLILTCIFMLRQHYRVNNRSTHF